MGVKNDFPTVKSVLPFRKNRKKGELLNTKKKIDNRKHSKLRVIVEHTVSRIKKYGIMGMKFRNRLGRYDLYFRHCFRIGKFQNNDAN